jgi:hypothetical protein
VSTQTMAIRTPEEIYEEIRAVPMPEWPKDGTGVELLAASEVVLAGQRRRERLWSELAGVVPHDAPSWAACAALDAAMGAFETRCRAERRVERYRMALPMKEEK